MSGDSDLVVLIHKQLFALWIGLSGFISVPGWILTRRRRRFSAIIIVQSGVFEVPDRADGDGSGVSRESTVILKLAYSTASRCEVVREDILLCLEAGSSLLMDID